MHYVEIQGEQVPKIGLGTWMLEGDACRAVVERALELGYRHIDTAQAYGNESKVGGALETSGIDRDEIFLTTKIAFDNLRRDAVLRSAHESRRRLASEYVDLLLVHWPSPDVPLGETLEAMMELQEDGVTRHVGVSNFPPSLLEEALTIAPILAVQVEYHPFLAQHRLLAMCRRADLMLTAYSPLARGRVAKEPVLQEIGERHGKTAAQVALRWLVQQTDVAAIPKASSEEHLRDDIDVFDFALSLDEVHRVDGLARGERLIDPEWAPRWEV